MDPDSIIYQHEVFEAGVKSAQPPFTFQSSQWEPKAKEHLGSRAWGYVNGNSGTGSTYEKNLAAFRRWSVVPRRLVPSSKDKMGNELLSDTKTTVLGHQLPYPIAIAPVGVQKIFNPAGEVGAAKAAGSLGIPYILSTATSTSPEDIARAMGDGMRWFQLYWPSRKHDDITVSLLKRAQAAGYTALFVTLDTYVLGWRPADLDTGFNPFWNPDRVGVEIGLTDPVFRKHFKDKHGYDIDEMDRHENGATNSGDGLGPAAREWTSIVFPGHSHTWEDIAFLKEHWEGPIVLKGIQSVEDARKCCEVGVQGIVVSNHGGRQQDGGCSSLGVLPRIVEAVGDKLDILFDSGIRCGTDIMKALALGAKCVLIGRPYIYGLAMGGEEGVRHILKAICGDLVMNMHLSGLRNISEVTKDILVKEDDLF
ncbi:L-lactate dehydrogenase (cytochrome) [Paramyrothecium foliicola]|nr:L-lactate dehydrogenase (cytochrome) [Paramyrothecium foliicola]